MKKREKLLLLRRALDELAPLVVVSDRDGNEVFSNRSVQALSHSGPDDTVVVQALEQAVATAIAGGTLHVSLSCSAHRDGH